MNLKQGFVVIAVVAVGATAVGLTYFQGSWHCLNGTWTKNGHPLSQKPQTVCTAPLPPSKICSPPWSCGKFTHDEAGMKPGAWYLKYEDVTGTAQMEISFDPLAACSIDGVSADCARMLPDSGASVSFKGYKDGDIFHVSSLSITQKK